MNRNNEWLEESKKATENFTSRYLTPILYVFSDESPICHHCDRCSDTDFLFNYLQTDQNQ